MAAVLRTTPIIVCGGGEKIGAGVIASLKPEYEVTQFILTPEAAIVEIPAILNGQVPLNPSSTIGTGNVTDRPVAVVLGGAYLNTFDEIHDSVEKAFGSSGSGIAWLRNDSSKPGPGVLGGKYPESVAQRTKERLGELGKEGKLGVGKTGVYWY